jgi:hypothetical protein
MRPLGSGGALLLVPPDPLSFSTTFYSLTVILLGDERPVDD